MERFNTPFRGIVFLPGAFIIEELPHPGGKRYFRTRGEARFKAEYIIKVPRLNTIIIKGKARTVLKKVPRLGTIIIKGKARTVLKKGFFSGAGP